MRWLRLASASVLCALFAANAVAQSESLFTRPIPKWVELSAELSRADLARLGKTPNLRLVVAAPKNQLSDRMIDAINEAQLSVNVAVSAALTPDNIAQIRRLERFELTVYVKPGEMSEELVALLGTVGPVMKHVVFVGETAAADVLYTRRLRFFSVMLMDLRPVELNRDLAHALSRIRPAYRSVMVSEDWAAADFARLGRLKSLRLFVKMKGNYVADDTLAALNSVRTVGIVVRLQGKLETHQLEQLAKVRGLEAYIEARGAVLPDALWDTLAMLVGAEPRSAQILAP